MFYANISCFNNSKVHSFFLIFTSKISIHLGKRDTVNMSYNNCPPGGSHDVKKESEVAQSCPTLCDPMDCSLPGSSIHGIVQAGVLDWVAISLSMMSWCSYKKFSVDCIPAGWRNHQSQKHLRLDLMKWVQWPLWSKIQLQQVFIWNKTPCCLVAKLCLAVLQPHGL